MLGQNFVRISIRSVKILIINWMDLIIEIYEVTIPLLREAKSQFTENNLSFESFKSTLGT